MRLGNLYLPQSLSLTLITHFFQLGSSREKDRIDKWKDLTGDRETTVYIQYIFKLKNASYELLWVIGVSVRGAKLLFLC